MAVECVLRAGDHGEGTGHAGQEVQRHRGGPGDRNPTLTSGAVDTYSPPTLLKLRASKQIDAARFVTHHFGFDEFDTAYDVFSRAGDTGALKVVLTR